MLLCPGTATRHLLYQTLCVLFTSYLPLSRAQSHTIAFLVDMKYCPNVLSRGTCEDAACRYEHQVLVCEPCGFIALSQKALTSHLKGRHHLNRVAGRSITYYCSLCETNVSSSTWNQHIKGSKHQKKAKSDNVTPNVEPLQGIDLKGEKYCDVCKQTIPARAWERHLSGSRHKMREKYTSYRAVLDEAEKDKNGIIVEGSFDFGIVEPTRAATGAALTVVLKTSTPNLRVKLVSLNRVSSRAGTNTTLAFVFFPLFIEADRVNFAVSLSLLKVPIGTLVPGRALSLRSPSSKCISAAMRIDWR